ncbi:MAG: hypothetical protein H6670_12635 [Anaerolineaceae bacterium]|nr:hypothetical protein [Anaerolineaceae bacterium]
MTYIWNVLGFFFALIAMVCFGTATAILLRAITIDALPPALVQNAVEISLALDTPVESILTQALVWIGIIMALLALVIYIGLLMGARHGETKALLDKIARHTRGTTF